MRNIKVSFLGLGIVGSQLMEYLQKNLSQIDKEYKTEIIVHRVYVRSLDKERSIDISGLNLTDQPYEALNGADVVIECMGGNGLELTRELVLTAIKAKKAVIMSSKKCLALYGKEIVEAVTKNKTIFHYDATVGGGIPISSVLESMGKCESIQKIYGVCNATSNYILTEMMTSHVDFETALRQAKDCGYAENNPEEDVDGYDALYKAVILMGFGMKKWQDCSCINPTSIKTLTEEDFEIARKSQCVVKPVFCIERSNDNYNCIVAPCFVENNSLLSTVHGNNNVLVICTNESGERAFFGQGAGKKPTASAMFDDFIKTIKELDQPSNFLHGHI